MVVALKHQLVDRIVIVEFDEAETAFSARAFIRHLLHVDDFSKSLEVVLQIVVRYAVLQAPDEDLGHGLTLA